MRLLHIQSIHSFGPGGAPPVLLMPPLGRGAADFAAAARDARAAVAATPNAEYRNGGNAPLLIIQGLDDRIAPPENGRQLKAELGDRVRLLELDQCGHAMLPERLRRIAAELIAYLKAQS